MNLGELRTAARLRLDDTEQDYLWSDDELNSFINEAVNEACIRARLNIDSTTPDVAEVNVIADTSQYELHDSVFFIERAYLETTKRALSKTSFHELDLMDPAWQDNTGDPTHYIMDVDHFTTDGALSNRLTLYPSPVKDEVLRLTTYRLPLEDMVLDADEPEIPRFHHSYLVDWACFRAYAKQDADTLSVDRALRFEQEFERRFGPRPEARRIEWQRKQRPKRVISRWL